MRIIAGIAKGHKLHSPGNSNRGKGIRPTSDRAREALFNILGPSAIKGKRVLDLFAGTGAIGIEALSRGAASVTFVDNNFFATNLIQHNLDKCGFSESNVFKRDILKSLFFLQGAGDSQNRADNNAFDLIILDPPYRLQIFEIVMQEIIKQKLLHSKSILVYEDSSSQQFPKEYMSIALFDQRKYGDTAFWFYTQLKEKYV